MMVYPYDHGCFLPHQGVLAAFVSDSLNGLCCVLTFLLILHFLAASRIPNKLLREQFTWFHLNRCNPIILKHANHGRNNQNNAHSNYLLSNCVRTIFFLLHICMYARDCIILTLIRMVCLRVLLQYFSYACGGDFLLCVSFFHGQSSQLCVY